MADGVDDRAQRLLGERREVVGRDAVAGHVRVGRARAYRVGVVSKVTVRLGDWLPDRVWDRLALASIR